MNSHKTDFLGQDKILPLLIKMSLPAAIGMIINALYNIVDTIFVGHGVGSLAIAALSIVFPIQMIISSFAQALGVGAGSIASRKLGERKSEEASHAVGTAVSAVFIITLIMVIFLMIYTRQILSFFGASENIMPYAVQYTEIVTPGFFFFALSMCISNLLRSGGNAKSSMAGMIIGALLNIILDPVFIFYFDMGVRGAALATVISQAASFSFFLLLYIFQKTHLAIRSRHLKIRGDILVSGAYLGVPVFVQGAGMNILVLIMNNSLGYYGGDSAISAYGMIFRLLSVIIMPVIGIAQGFQPIAGYNYGAGRYDRVKNSLYTALTTAFLISLTGYFIMMFSPEICISLFTSDRAIISANSAILRIFAFFIPLASIQITGSTYFQAVGKPHETFILGISRQFLILIPLVIILPRFIGLTGIWISFPLSDILSTVLTVILLALEIRKIGIK